MSADKIVKAWKDAEFREGLSDEEKAKLPDNPAGEVEPVEVDDAELDQVVGGGNTVYDCYASYQGTCELATSGCC